jgi:hypothetical protein
VNACLCIDANEFDASPLKDALLQLPGDAQRGHEDGAAVAGSERFDALSDAAYDVVAW